MKLNKLFCGLLAAAAIIMASDTAQAVGPFKFGIKAGATVNDMKFNQDLLKSDNRCGWTAGVMTKFTAPLIGVGFDASLMYTRRTSHLEAFDADGQFAGSDNVNSNYIEIPINLRYDFSLPVVGKFVTPFLTTGPDLSFLMSKEHATEAWTKKKFDFAWNFGFGLMFVDKVQLHASYGLGINNAASVDEGAGSLYGTFNGKNRFWTVTAAYLF